MADKSVYNIDKDSFAPINTISSDMTDVLWTTLQCTEELTKEYIKTALEDIKLFDRKQHDYGSGNISKFGEFGVLVRSSDKLERLANLRKKQMELSQPANSFALNETMEDSWADLSVYGVIARMVRGGVWK